MKYYILIKNQLELWAYHWIQKNQILLQYFVSNPILHVLWRLKENFFFFKRFGHPDFSKPSLPVPLCPVLSHFLENPPSLSSLISSMYGPLNTHKYLCNYLRNLNVCSLEHKYPTLRK